MDEPTSPEQHLRVIESLVERIEDLDLLPAKPVVSVVIVTYNHAEYIRDALRGVLMQEVDFPIELIVADDASTDGTREILLDYQRRHPDVLRLRLAKENMYRRVQRYPAFGARASVRGKYVALCEGDDYWTDPLKLQKQVDLLESRPELSFCFTATEFTDEGDPGSYRRFGAPDERDTYDRLDLLEYNFVTTCTVVYRAEALSRMPDFYWQTPVGDWPTFMTLARSGPIGYLDEVTAVRRVHAGGEWSKLSRLGKLRCSIDTWEPALGDLSAAERKVWHRFLRGKKRRVATQLLMRGMYGDAARAARESLSHKIRSDKPLAGLPEYAYLGLASTPSGARSVRWIMRAVEGFRRSTGV